MIQTSQQRCLPHTGGGKLNDWSIQGQLEGCAGSLLFALLPALLYCVTTFGMSRELQHVWSLLLLASAPMLMLTTIKVSLVDNLMEHLSLLFHSCCHNAL